MLVLCADDVYGEVKQQAKDAILAAIDKERDGEQIDRSLLKNVLGIFIEVRTACIPTRAHAQSIYSFVQAKGQHRLPPAKPLAHALMQCVHGCAQVGMGTMDCYTEDFEKFLLSETAAFYRKKAAAWIVVRSLSCALLPACHARRGTLTPNR